MDRKFKEKLREFKKDYDELVYDIKDILKYIGYCILENAANFIINLIILKAKVSIYLKENLSFFKNYRGL